MAKTLNWFQEEIERVRSHGEYNDALTYNAIGLGGEAGEVLNEIKKSMRPNSDDRTARVRDELANVLFYVARMCTLMGFNMDEVMDRQIVLCEEKNLESRKAKS
jgi:NTP pyrophosphatase (non-canonical NTP hydrolase)